MTWRCLQQKLLINIYAALYILSPGLLIQCKLAPPLPLFLPFPPFLKTAPDYLPLQLPHPPTTRQAVCNINYGFISAMQANLISI